MSDGVVIPGPGSSSSAESNARLRAENAELRKLLVTLCAGAKPLADAGVALARIKPLADAKEIGKHAAERAAILKKLKDDDYVRVALALAHVLKAAPK